MDMKVIVTEAVRFVRDAKKNSRGNLESEKFAYFSRSFEISSNIFIIQLTNFSSFFSVRVISGSIPPLDTPRATSPLAIRYTSDAIALSNISGSGSGPRSPPRTLKSSESEADSSEFEEILEKSLKNVLAEGNPVLQLFTRRIYKVLLRALLNQPYVSRLPSLSLHAKGIQRNLSELIARTVKLFIFHNSVYEDVYSMIFASNTFQTHVYPDLLTDVD